MFSLDVYTICLPHMFAFSGLQEACSQSPSSVFLRAVPACQSLLLRPRLDHIMCFYIESITMLPPIAFYFLKCNAIISQWCNLLLHSILNVPVSPSLIISCHHPIKKPQTKIFKPIPFLADFRSHLKKSLHRAQSQVLFQYCFPKHHRNVIFACLIERSTFLRTSLSSPPPLSLSPCFWYL